MWASRRQKVLDQLAVERTRRNIAVLQERRECSSFQSQPAPNTAVAKPRSQAT
jgi:hypothetical protein